MNDNVQQGQTIINSLLAEGVQQWAASALSYEDDWKDVESLQSRANFADDCLAHLKDEDSKNVIVSVLLAEAVDTFDALVSTWPEKERAKVPVVNEGIQAGRAWLEQHSAIKPKHKGVSVNDSNCKAETIEEFCVEVGIDLHAPEAQGRWDAYVKNVLLPRYEEETEQEFEPIFTILRADAERAGISFHDLLRDLAKQ